MAEQKQTETNVIDLHPKRRSATPLYVLLAVALIGVCIYQIFKINYTPVKTEIALQKTISRSATTEAFVVRDETYITANVSGTLVPLAADGKRVARGDNVAVVFTSEDSARTYSQMQELRTQIAYYESLKNKIGIQTSDVEALDDRIYSACESYVRAAASATVDGLDVYSDAVCEAITSRQLSTGTVIDPTEKLAALHTQLAALQENAGGYTTVQANNPGYYIAHVDGYENAIPYADAKTADGETIERLLQMSPVPSAQLQNCMGKLVDSFNWYFLCILDTESAAGLQTGKSVTVEFPLTAAESISAQVVSMQNFGTDKVAVVLCSNLMNTQYAGLRKEQIRLVLESFTGLQVSNRAIREVNGEKGVYIVSGNIIKFKKIHIAYSDAQYSVCVTPKNENGADESGYVSLYDEVIVEGTDLYDGKILD